jgi:hypothetical protein
LKENKSGGVAMSAATARSLDAAPVYKTQLAFWPALGIIVALGFFGLYRRQARK